MSMFSNKGFSQNTFEVGDSFWKDYNSLGSRYRSQMSPYLKYNYTTGLWDKIGNFFGFNTGEDRYRMQMQDRARQALAGLKTDEFQNQYNSQSEQAQRMRDAGLNPDLAGEATGDPASSLEQPLSPIDPSVFDLPKDLLNGVSSVFGFATDGLLQIGNFAKVLSDISKVRSETTNVQISSLQDAYDYAGKYLAGYDPKTRLDFGDVSDVKEDFFNQKLTESVLRDFKVDNPGLSSEANKLVNRQLRARLSDPRVQKEFYDAYTGATSSKVNKVAYDMVFGQALSSAEDVVKSQNETMLEYITRAIMANAEYNAVLADYNLKKTENDWDYETWKAHYGIPETVAEADLANYMASKAQSKALELKSNYFRKTLKSLYRLSKKGDKASKYLLNGFLNNGSFAPLLHNQVGPIGFNRFLVPGSPDNALGGDFNFDFGTNSKNPLFNAGQKISDWLNNYGISLP